MWALLGVHTANFWKLEAPIDRFALNPFPISHEYKREKFSLAFMVIRSVLSLISPSQSFIV